MTYQATVRRLTLVTAILVAVGLTLFLTAPFGKGVSLAQASAENTPATGAPTITGTAQVGETLTADTTGIADADGLSGVAYSYQWLADDTEIDGATGSTYTVQSSDAGKPIKVQVTFTDDAGNSETLTGYIKDDIGDSGGEDADLTHDAVADDAGHKVATLVQPPKSRDATLSALSLKSETSLWVYAPPDTTENTDVANYVSSVTVTALVNHSGASYVVRLGGVTDADGTVSLAVGSNDITVVVTAEDGSTTKTYTVTVTRAVPSTDATLSYVLLSGIDIGNGLGERAYAQAQPSFSASVYNSISQTTVTPTLNHSAASYVVKLGGVTDADGVIPLAVGSNVITVEVTAEDGQATKTYTATVNRAAASAPTTGELATDDPPVNFRTNSYTHSFIALALSFPRNRGITGVVTQRYEHDGDNFVSAGADGRYEDTSDDDLGGLNLSWTYTEPEPDTLYKWVVQLVNSQDATVIETSLEVRTPPEPGSTPLSSDATLSDLTLTGVDFEATDRIFVGPGFNSTVISYVGSVANSVTETTVTATTRHSSATYAVKLGGVADADGTVSLAVGRNVITVEVTAEDGETTRTYTVTVTRVSSDASTDATLRRLVLSDVDYGTFAPNTTTYTAQVANSVAETLVTPYVSHWGASYVVKLGGVTDINRRTSLAVGSNVITVEVTAEDLVTTKTYTITVTRAAVSATAPDLVVSSVSIGSSPFGDPSFTLHATAHNQGSGSSGSTTLRYYLSADSTITSRDLEIGTDAVGGLHASGSSEESIDLIEPSAPGTYHYGACVDTVSDELETTNNCSSVAVRVNVAHPNSLATGAPIITGTAQVGQILTADTSGIADSDGLTNVAYDYQWLADDTEIASAAGNAYVLTSAELGKAVKVRVSFTDDAGNEESLTSAATDAVAAVPPPPPDNVRAVTQESGAVELTWEAPQDATVTGYRIERRPAGEDGSGPQRSHGRPRDHHTLVEDTGSADTGYTDESSEQGVEYEYRVSARNESGPGEGSDWVRAGPESASNSPATGAPTITGTTQVGQTLTADTSGIADADGLSGETFTYQWVSGDGTTDTDIEKATDSTYKLVVADQGKSVKVRVTFTDDGGNEETLTSAPTGPVFGDGLPGAPRNLTATPGNKEITLSWEPPADNGNLPATRYRIEWRMDGKDYKKGHWGTAGSTTYTKTDLANGVKYFFRVKAENGSGNSYGPYGPASEEVSATPTSGSAVDLGTPVLSNTKTLHHGMVQLDWEDIEDAGWYVVQYYHVKSGKWLDLPAAGVDIAFHGSSAVASNLHGLSWLRVRAMSCAGSSEWSQIEELYGTNASDWEDMPVPEVAEGDQIEPCPVVLGTPVLSGPETLHHGMVRLDWQDIEDAGWYVVQYYHVKSGEWLDLPAAGVDIAFHGSSAVASNLHGLSWLRVRAMSCAGESEWSQIEELYGTNASDWEGVPVPEVAEGDEIKPCDEDADTSDNSPATGAPTISGTVQVGETLTADTSGIADADGLANATFSYQWITDDSVIVASAARTYTPTDGDRGKSIKVRVSFTDDAGNEETRTSANTATVEARANSPATGLPTISGTAQVGETLTANTSGVADADGLSNVQYEYRWLANDSGISGATNATYTLVAADEGQVIKVRVSFTDDAGNNETLTSAGTAAVSAANTPATGAPAISGTAQVGETLTANTSGVADVDGLSNVQYEYRWIANDSGISGATNATYTLVAADEGQVIKVRASFTDDAGNNETLTSAATEAVSAANTPATGAPTIIGTAQVGEALAVDTSGIADAEGLTNVLFTYQWLADDADINGAIGSTYTMEEADAGKRIKVKVSFTDDADNEETLTSVATTAVAGAAPAISGAPSYITVEVTEDSSDPNNIITNFTITWSDAALCSVGYNAYLRTRTGDETEGSQLHLGSAASDGAQITAGLTGVQGGVFGFDVELYCGTDESGRLVSKRFIRTANGRPKPHIYYSEPPLSELSVSHGTFIPTFNSYTSDYTIPDVANADTRITITAIPKTGYAVEFFESSGNGVSGLAVYSPGASGLSSDCNRSHFDALGPLIELTDADPNTAGFQVDLYDGENHVEVAVYPTEYCAAGRGTRSGYGLAITRAEGSISLIRPNRPPIGFPGTGWNYFSEGGPCIGCTLSAAVSHIRDRDGMADAIFSYQWLADDAEITGAISSSYTVATADVGKTLKVRVSFTDDRGTVETLTSSATKVVKLRNLNPTGKPIVLGTLEVGQTLRADVSGISDRNGLINATFTYEWSGSFAGVLADGEEYTLVDADAGHRMKLRVNYTDDAGHEERLYSEFTGEVAPRPGGAVEDDIDLEPVDEHSSQYVDYITPEYPDPPAEPGRLSIAMYHGVGSAVPVVHGLVPDSDPDTLDYVVSLRVVDDDDNPVANCNQGGVGGSYLLYTIPEDRQWHRTVTFSELCMSGASSATLMIELLNGSSEFMRRDEVRFLAVVDSPATGTPTISGTAQVGETLTAATSDIADANGLSNVQYKYQWLADDADISGATNATYTLAAADEGKAIKVQVSFTDDEGNEETLTSTATDAVSAALPPPPDNLRAVTQKSGAVELTWDAPQDATVTGYRIERRPTGGSPSDQQRSDGSPRDNHTLVEDTGSADTSYTDNTAQEGVGYEYRVSARNEAGAGAESDWVNAEEATAPNSPATGARTISGTAQVGETLTADTSDIADADGLSNVQYEYQWLADDAEIAGATGSTYTLVSAEEGKVIKVQVNFADDAGNEETLTSAATDAVAAAPTPNSPATGDPTISGSAQVGETLTADTSEVADSDGLSNVQYEYQWLADDTDIAGATSLTYTLIDVDEGKAIKVQVSFTDDEGNAETLTSAATAAVTDVPPSTTPGEPQNLELTPVAVGTNGVGIKVFWDAPSATGGSDISGYRIQWKGGSQDYPDDQETRQAFVENAPYTIDTTSPTPIEGDELTVRVAAVNGAGAGVWTEKIGWLPSHTDLELWLLMKEYADEKQTTFPWVLETWKYLDRYEVPVEVGPTEGFGSVIFLPCGSLYTNGDDGLKECHVEKFKILQIEDPKPRIIIHEMAHVYSLANRVTEAPGPLAIAHLYFDSLNLQGGLRGCEPRELYADVLTMLTLDIDESSYWKTCNGDNAQREAQALDVLRSAVDGEMPQWFADTYTDAEDEPDLERLWTDVQDLPRIERNVAVYQLRDAFGGYCNNRLTWKSMQYSEDKLTQPWMDGGCPPPEPSSLEVTPGEGELTLAWDAPASDGDSDVEGYIVQWKSVYKSYDDWATRRWRAVLDSPTSLTYTISGLGNGIEYDVRVRAYNAIGPGQPLDVESVTTSEPAIPAIPENTRPTGVPTITGTAQVGEVLTVDTSGISDEDGMENASFTFNWGASGYVRATGAVTEYTIQTDDEYTIQTDDEGKRVYVVAFFKDDKGNWEVVYSALTSVVEARPNSPATGAPSISGTAQVGEALTADTSGIADADGLTNASFTYQWLADDTEIAGATGLTYTLTDSDEGKAIKVQVSFTDDAGNDETLTSAATDAVASAPTPNSPATDAPTISGSAQVGETLTADTSDIADADGLSNVQYEYQWLADDADISGATSLTYTLAAADEGKAIKVEVTFIDDAGNDESLTSAATDAVASAPTPNTPATGAPTITGTVQVGETLTAGTSEIEDADGLSNLQYEYRWLADDAEVAGATSLTYTLADTDEGKAIKVQVSFTDDAGNEETLTSAATDAVAAAPTTNTPATGAPTISGTVQVGETLTANTSGIADADGLSNVQYDYQWLADDTDIAGATGLTYTLTDSEESKAITVQVSFTDDADNQETLTSGATDTVEAAPTTNSPATGAPTITGTAQVGETLTANTSGVADADGLSSVQYEYQWLADDAEVAGATGSTYTLVADDMGKAISVSVSFTDAADNEETLTSAATEAAAARPNSLATGAPTISGTVQVGETLTADTSGLADSDGLTNATFSYQWLADDTEIAGATSLTYTLADVDEGKAIKVEASFTDDEGNDESLTSAATAAVAAAEPSEPPDRPRGLEATATHDSVTLTWDDPGDDSITGYVILRRVRENDQGGEFSVLVPDTGSAAATYTDDTVAASTTYTYRIKAINGAGTSERSRWFHIDIPAAPVPDKPTGLSATAAHDSVTLTWNDPGDDSITGYVILRRLPGVDPEGQFDELVSNTGTAELTYTDDTVAAETRYTYRIKAINEHGTSERSRWYHIDTPAAP